MSDLLPDMSLPEDYSDPAQFTPEAVSETAGDGGTSAGFDQAMGTYNAVSQEAAMRNIDMMIAGVENGVMIKSAQQRASAL